MPIEEPSIPNEREETPKDIAMRGTAIVMLPMSMSTKNGAK